jgi:hypothetical protein
MADPAKVGWCLVQHHGLDKTEADRKLLALPGIQT